MRDEADYKWSDAALEHTGAMVSTTLVPPYVRHVALGVGLLILSQLRNRMVGRRSVPAALPPAQPAQLPRLIFVLGSQRSGTNAIRQSLSLDPYVRGFNERESNNLYEDWKLRPEPEIRRFLQQQPGTVLLKPIKSVIDRPVAEFLTEFADYAYKVVWIYRDPVLVFGSRSKRWSYLDDVDQFLEEWNRVNRSALDAADERMAVVHYADLIERREVFYAVCRFLGVRGEYLFRPDESRAYEEIDQVDIKRIQESTADTLQALDAARTSVPATVA